MLKKFGLENSKITKTLMCRKRVLTLDKDNESVDSTKYRGMIGSLLYLTASRLDIMFRVFLYARFQEDPKISHLEAVKRILSFKALDEGFCSKNYARKFLWYLHPKWIAKVTTREESKDLSSLALDELISNLKVHEVVMEKDSKVYKGKNEWVKSLALKAKKESCDDETSTSGSDDEEYAMAVRIFKKFFRRKGRFVRQPREEKKSFQQRDDKKGKSDRKYFRCGDPNHLIGECPKPSRNKDQKAFVGGSWSDSENEAEDKTNEETYLMAQSSKEVCLRIGLVSWTNGLKIAVAPNI
ncbi:zf-CCHC domain-containing protein [Tanacetum coccineum]|uniref:Zf-CCHC domain-containing protein n=1 Tax=Tanacetum coccineum TaxID=301880 RepID=A0ABQ5CMH8_9ASTR